MAGRQLHSVHMDGWPMGLYTDTDNKTRKNYGPKTLSRAINCELDRQGRIVLPGEYREMGKSTMPPGGLDRVVFVKQLGDAAVAHDINFQWLGCSDINWDGTDFGDDWIEINKGWSETAIANVADACRVEDDVYVTCSITGTSGPYDLSYTDIPSFSAASSWTAVASAPHGSCIAWHHDRMFLGGDEANPSRLYFSALGDPTSWTVGTDYLDIEPASGGITALIQYGDDLMIFKNNAIWILAGRSTASYTLYRLDSARGTADKATVAVNGSDVFFFDHQQRVIWKYDGSGFINIGAPIAQMVDYMTAGILPNVGITAISGAYAPDRGLYIIGMTVLATHSPEGYFTQRHDIDLKDLTLVYHDELEAWTTYDFAMTAGDYEVYWFDVNPFRRFDFVQNTLQDRSNTSDTTVELTVRTDWINVGRPGMLGRIQRLEMMLLCDPTNPITVNMYRDFDPTNIYVTQTITGGNPELDGTITRTLERRQVGVNGWGDKITSAMFEIVVGKNQTDVNSDAFILESLDVLFTSSADLQGDR